ncbi:MAG TPA: BMP family ABC transporter substrate-binding protein [Candidatus Dormibacteraeota bacterium]|nr:BMP family ABC transporter substrate-binding protein [Candidatus Dormibacteraeota bacterium]
MAFVTDAGGLRADGPAYRGVTQAVGQIGCAKSELISSVRPSDYRRNLQLAADHHNDLVVAASFLLSDAVVAAAQSNPGIPFLLVDAVVLPAGAPNLTEIAFRRDQAAFLAGALAAMLTRSGVVAGVYGPGGTIDQQQRLAFQRGADYVRPGLRVLGADQPADDGAPYGNPAWGESQARAFAGQKADVIFGAGGGTGAGALAGAAAMGRLCIGVDVIALPAPEDPSCLVANARTSIDRGVDLEVVAAARGSRTTWLVSVGLREGAVGLDSFGPALTPEIQQRLRDIADKLIAGTLFTGV